MARAAKPGAPAKPASEKYQAVTLRLHPAAVKQLRRLAKRLKLSQGQTVTQALDALEGLAMVDAGLKRPKGAK